tara:strand:- start:14016 stop:14639 length:624 start_codon:yes stop_codon:yes gene_type:complete
MFQAIVCMSGFDIDMIDDIKNTSPKHCTMLHKPLASCPGALGERAELAVLLDLIEPYMIGSIQLKVIHNNIKYSILIFKSGKLKISGGCGSINEHNTLKNNISTIASLIAQWVKSSISLLDITLINGQFNLKKMSITELQNKIRYVEKHFEVIKKPIYDLPGRRGAYKLYIYGNRKFHVALDTGGCCQIFAAKTYDELKFIYNIMID